MNRLSAQKTGWVVAFTCLVMGFNTTRLGAQPNTATATMTINLSNVLQLTVNTPTVGLNFATAANYNNGVTSVVNNQVTVGCNRAYSISVKTAGPNLTSGANTIPVSNISVRTTGLAVGTPRIIAALSTTDQSLVTGLPAAMAQSVNVQYSTTAGNTAFLKPAGAYTTTITFTAIAN